MLKGLDTRVETARHPSRKCLIVSLEKKNAINCVQTLLPIRTCALHIGLSVVMVINFGIAWAFGWFVLRYTNRHQAGGVH